MPRPAALLPHEAAEMFRLMAEEIKECAIFLMDVHGLITVWNRGAETMKGYAAHEVIGHHLGMLYRDEDRARGCPEHNLREARRHGYYSEETWRRRKDGTLFWAHIALTALRDADNVLVGYSKVTLDLSRHKQLEQCLVDKEENRRIMAAANAGTWQWSPRSRRLELSPALLALLGYSPQQMPRRGGWRRLVAAQDVPALRVQLRAMLRHCPSPPLMTQLRLYRRDGGSRWFYLRADWQCQEADGDCVLMGVCVDVHELKMLEQEREQLQQQLHSERLRFAAILEQMPSGVFVAEAPSGKLIYQNRQAKAIFGQPLFNTDSYYDYAQFDLRHQDGRRMRPADFPLARVVLRGETIVAEEVVCKTAQGKAAHFSVNAAPVLEEDGSRRVAVAVLHDIDDLKQMQKSLQVEKERAQVTLTAITNGVITTDLAGYIDRMNPAAERLTGYRQQEACGRAIGDVVRFIDEEGEQPLPDPLAQCLREQRVVVSTVHAVLLARDGQRHSIEFSAAPLQLPGNRHDGAVLVMNDVSESRGLLNNLRYQASHDVLTGLVNRREFGARLQRALERTKQTAASSGALLYMDLDQFKIVNDTCGHAAGDDLLRQLSLAYCTHVRERDTLARIGGDEFALIVEHCTVQEALTVAHKLLDTTRDFRYVYKDQAFQLGVSIGLIPIDGSTDTVEEALRQVDHACYIAKETGRNRIFVQHSGDAEMKRRRNDMYWVKRLGDAFRGDQLQLFYQPIHALGRAGGGYHYEILLRMKDGEAGPICPNTFLPAAERYDIMPDVDRWVLNKSLEWLEAHPAHVEKLQLCTINLSQRALADVSFQQYAAGRIRAMSIPASKLCFEITETGAVANMHNTLSFIMALKELGCCFALDDFGTGMASFAYLKQIPVNYVKIDGSFIQMMTQSTVDFEMVRFTNDISHIMGRQTIAEFVNDATTLDMLTEIGVDFAQGFLLGPPQPLTN